MDKRTQQEKILEHMRDRGGITPLEALDLYGCFRLGARIYDLRRRGYTIISRMVSGAEGKKFSEYSLVPMPEHVARDIGYPVAGKERAS